MKRTVGLIAVAVAIASASAVTGCASKRYVTRAHWHDGDTLVVAYREISGTDDAGRVKVCRRQPDNALKCRPLEAVNRLLVAPEAPGKATDAPAP